MNLTYTFIEDLPCTSGYKNTRSLSHEKTTDSNDSWENNVVGLQLSSRLVVREGLAEEVTFRPRLE